MPGYRVILEAALVAVLCAAVVLPMPLVAESRTPEIRIASVGGAPEDAAAFEVTIDAPYPVLGVQFDLAYDSTKCTVRDVKEGTFFRPGAEDPLGVTFFHPGIGGDGSVVAVAGCRLYCKERSVSGTGSVATFVVESVDGRSCGLEELSLDNIVVIGAGGVVVLATGDHADRRNQFAPVA